MKYPFTFILIFLYLHGVSQEVANVAVDSLSFRLFPIYSEAIKSGIYDLPRDTTWRNLKKYDAPGISFEVPENWINLGGLNSIVETAFDATGLYFPDTFRLQPILAGVFLLNIPGSSNEEAKDLTLKEYRSNPDRVFERGYSDTVSVFRLDNGKTGYLLHTRFLRLSTQLNQSRYDLIIFSEKVKKSYSVMVSVQYADPTYRFEDINELSVFAVRLFSHVRLE